MANLTEEEFTKLAHLCRIHCSQEEKQIISVKLEKILAHISQLGELDTSNTPPCYLVSPQKEAFLRQDEPKATLSRQEFLANAPSHTGGMIRVPPTLTE